MKNVTQQSRYFCTERETKRKKKGGGEREGGGEGADEDISGRRESKAVAARHGGREGAPSFNSCSCRDKLGVGD